jgi:hypothetical protein
MTAQYSTRDIFAAVQAPRAFVDLKQAVAALMRKEAKLLSTQGESTMLYQRHPLGFFACRWPLDDGHALRVHVWSKLFTWAQEPGWEIHDHVFSFASAVLNGTLRNRTYEMNADDTLPDGSGSAMYEVAYSGPTSTMRLVRCGVVLRAVSDAKESAGAYYSVDAGVLHSSELLSNRALTVLATTTVSTPGLAPRVISAHRQGPVAFDRSPMSPGDVAKLLVEAAVDLESKG